MKTIKQILEQYDTLTNKKTNENQKLVALVREGLLDESKLSLVERALTLDTELMTTVLDESADMCASMRSTMSASNFLSGNCRPQPLSNL